MALKGVTKSRPLPPMIMLCGDPGSGKTTLAYSFRDWAPVIFISAEPISGVFDHLPEGERPDMFPQLPVAEAHDKKATTATALSQIRQLRDEEHDYGVLVIDTVSALDALLQTQVLVDLGGENLAVAGGGYGAGWQTLFNYHQQIINACIDLRAARDMCIIFLAHQNIGRLRNRPDAEEAIVFDINMHEKCHALYRGPCDMVAFCRIESFTKGVTTDNKGQVKKAGKLITTGDRSIITAADGAPGYVHAKNRYGIPSEIPFPLGEPVLLDAIEYFNAE